MNDPSVFERKYRLPSGILDAVWAQESGRGKNMLNKSSGAAGHFQIMPANYEKAGIDPYDFEQSAEWTAKNAAAAIEAFPDMDPVDAIAAVHYGGPNTSQWGPRTNKYRQDIANRMGNTVPASKIKGDPDVYPGGSIQPLGGNMNPNVINMLTQSQGQQAPVAPSHPMMGLIEDPMFQMGSNILANSGPGNFMSNVGAGISDATGVLQKQEQRRLNRAQQQLRDPRTANIKDAEYLQERKRQLDNGEITPEAFQQDVDIMLSQKEPGYERNKALESAEGGGLPKNVDEARQGVEMAQGLLDKSFRVKDTLNQIKTFAGGAGWPAAFSWVRNTDASKLQKAVDNLTSNVVLDEMMRLKEMSSHGSTGFGAMSEKELAVLIDSIQSLNTADSDNIRERMEKMFHAYQKVADRAYRKYNEHLTQYRAYKDQLSYPPTQTFQDQPSTYWDNYDKAQKAFETGEDAAPPPSGQPPSGGFEGWGPIERVN